VLISRRARVLDYLGSAHNLIGSALGLVALLRHVHGVSRKRASLFEGFSQ
jgi:hypothetical protein